MSRKTEIIDNYKVDIGEIVEDARDFISDLADAKVGPKLVVNIDATHSGRLTNNRVYPGTAVKSSVNTFLKPTPRPVLKNHDDMSDPIGRVSKAKFVQLKTGDEFANDFKRPSAGHGSGFINLSLDIMDQDAVGKFLDGRFREFSTRQTFTKFLCSFCGQDMAEEFCGHYPGDTVRVEGKKGAKDKSYKVFGITGPLNYKEVSVVNIPGDAFTKVNEMELQGVDAFGGKDDLVLTCNSADLLDVNGLYLTDSAGVEFVNLVAEGDHTNITAEDRKRLTGKTIVAVGPLYSPTETAIEVQTMENEEKTEQINDEVVDDITNTDSNETSDGESEPAADDSNDNESKEDVVVPVDENQDSGAKGEDELSDEEVMAGYKALASRNKALETDVKEKESEIARLKGEASDKEKEIERLKKAFTESASALKHAFARQLLDAKIILAKPDVASVENMEAYDNKLVEFSERTIESLKDALDDLSPELIVYKEQKGIKTSDLLGNEKEENPTANVKPMSKDKEEDKEEAEPMTRDQLIDSSL
jgi:hypothetical protein